MLMRIVHETKLGYNEPVSENVFEVRMAPPGNEDQTVLGYRLRTTPAVPITTFRDGFGNQVELFNVLAPHREVVVRAMSFVRSHRRPGKERLAEVAWPGEFPPPMETLEFLQPSQLVNASPELEAFRKSLPEPSGSLADVVEMLLTEVGRRLQYEKKVTTAWTPVSEALSLGRGVCQDFAHLFLGACRGIGLPARYVSGYVNHPGETATHAWCQVWGGTRAGWVDVDPTRGTFVVDEHVVIGVGRDYGDLPPNRGVWKGSAKETISVSVKVEPVERMPSDWTDVGSQVVRNGNGTTHRRKYQNGNANAMVMSGGRVMLRQQQSQQQ